MKLSLKSQYGLQAMLSLALHYLSGSVQIASIAKDQNIPIRFLEQLLLILKKKGLLSSQRGINGGYTLAKHPSDITLFEIIETLEGPIEFTSKKLKRSAAIFETLENIHSNLKNDLSKRTLEDLVTKKYQKDKAFNYSI